MTGAVSPQAIIGFLGPPGTFTEEALRSQPELSRAQLQPLRSFVHVLSAVTDGTVDFGFVALQGRVHGLAPILRVFHFFNAICFSMGFYVDFREPSKLFMELRSEDLRRTEASKAGWTLPASM